MVIAGKTLKMHPAVIIQVITVGAALFGTGITRLPAGLGVDGPLQQGATAASCGGRRSQASPQWSGAPVKIGDRPPSGVGKSVQSGDEIRTLVHRHRLHDARQLFTTPLDYLFHHGGPMRGEGQQHFPTVSGILPLRHQLGDQQAVDLRIAMEKLISNSAASRRRFTSPGYVGRGRTRGVVNR